MRPPLHQGHLHLRIPCNVSDNLPILAYYYWKHGPWQFASHRFHLASSWSTVDSPRSRVRNLLVHLLQQDIPQPVFHIHEVPFQHFGKELAKETLLAFHGEPVGPLARTFASLSNSVLIHKVYKAVAFLFSCGRVENMDGPEDWAILGKMLPELLLLERVTDFPKPKCGRPHQHLKTELGQGDLHWLLVHMVLGVLEYTL